MVTNATKWAVVCLATALTLSEAQAGLNASSFAPIEFSNRAQCALDSRLPARSVLVVGDGYDAGRLGFNIAKLNAGVSAGKETDAMETYRRAVGFTFTTVANRLLAGHLPLLDQQLRGLLSTCESTKKCRALDLELSELWKKSQDQALSSAQHVTCIKSDRFSALQGHLNKSRPSLSDLNELGALLSKSQPTCEQSSPTTDRFFLLQIDLPSVPKNFDSIGFDFWRSLKTYASWAWRSAPEVRAAMGRYAELFPGLALEDEVLLAPNGCRAITLPVCDLQRLSLDAVRELAKPPQTASGFEAELPNGPQFDLLSKGSRSVADGFLGTNGTATEEWVKNFSKRFNEARWVSRNKLQSVARTGSWLNQLSAATLTEDLKRDLERFSPEANPEFASQLAAVCVEARILRDPQFKVLRPDFESVLESGSTLGLSASELKNQKLLLPRVIEAVKTIGLNIKPICESLESSLFSKVSYDYGYLSDWARERMNGLVSQKSLPKETRVRGWNRPEPYLTLSEGKVEICRSPIACMQSVLKAYVDLYSVSVWSAALGRAHRLKDSNLFNPYAELNACKVYDPWFATDQANAMLTQRLITSALTAALPVPIFAEFESKRPQVKSFNTKIDNGAVRFEPEFSDESNRRTFFADLGPLTGAPCAVQYANEAGAPFQVYGVGGVTLNYCSDNKGSETELNDKSEGKTSAARRSICGGCTINLTSAVSSIAAAAPAGPIRFAFGAARAFSLYVNAQKDEKNRPISYIVRPEYVADAYSESRGSIPARCEPSLINGFRCFEDLCAANAAHVLETKTGLRATSAGIQYEGESTFTHQGPSSGTVGIRVNECDGEIMARVSCDPTMRRFEMRSEFSAFSRSCTALLERSQPGGVR